jgi:hypothetical protein
MTGKRIPLLFIFSTLLFGITTGQQNTSKPEWSYFQFLIGSWSGDGSGNPGEGKGDFTFSLDLQDHILVRHNRSDYPATESHPAFSHTDLMIIYPASNHPANAIYFDNEGHIIQYSVYLSENKNTVIFISDSSDSAPRFRLTYMALSADSLLITFEIAPPGKPGEFSVYLTGSVKKVNSGSQPESLGKTK